MAVILIVEDDGLVAQHTAQVLRRLGHRPILAADARAARAEVTAAPDLVLLDLGLPDLAGEDLLRWLRTRSATAWIPVLVLTGREDAAARVGVGAGMCPTAILKKPVPDEQLGQAVTAALAHPRDGAARWWDDERRQEIVRQVIAAGSEGLAAHVYRRVTADRLPDATDTIQSALSWDEIGTWAVLEGVLDREQALLLSRHPRYSGRNGLPPRSEGSTPGEKSQ
jgi:DNA-binding response OmpR family regulator